MHIFASSTLSHILVQFVSPQGIKHVSMRKITEIAMVLTFVVLFATESESALMMVHHLPRRQSNTLIVKPPRPSKSILPNVSEISRFLPYGYWRPL